MPLVNQAQDGIATPAEAELTSHIRSCLPSSCESKLTERFLQSFRALRMRTAEFWESFHEDFLSASALFTEKTTDMHDETDGMPNGGKIAQRPCIATLDARRYGSTGGASSCWGCRTEGQGDLLSYFYSFHFDIGKVWKNDHRMALGPRKSYAKAKKCSISKYTIWVISKVA